MDSRPSKAGISRPVSSNSKNTNATPRVSSYFSQQRTSAQKSTRKNGKNDAQTDPVVPAKRMDSIDSQSDIDLDFLTDDSDLEFFKSDKTLDSKTDSSSKKQKLDVTLGPSNLTQNKCNPEATLSNETYNFDLEFSQPQKKTGIKPKPQSKSLTKNNTPNSDFLFDLEASQPNKNSEPSKPNPQAENKPHPRKILNRPNKDAIAKASAKRKLMFSYNPSSKTPSVPVTEDLDQQEEQLHKREDFRKRFRSLLNGKAILTDSSNNNITDPLCDDQDNQQAENDSENQDDIPDTKSKSSATSRSSRKSTRSKSKSSLTPMDQQYVDFKSRHPDLILLFESGYQYRMFGIDAKIGADIFKNVLRQGKLTLNPEDPADSKYTKYASLTLMEGNLSRKVELLVTAGHKVGLVQQTETAASKAIESTNRHSLFERKLTKIYTKATMVDREDFNSTEANRSSYILAIAEDDEQSEYDDAKVNGLHPTSRSSQYRIGLVAIQMTTGEILYDDFFDDDALHTELETRLIHIQPSEILFVGKPRVTVKKLIKQLIVSRTLSDDPRIETIPKKSNIDAVNHVANFYSQQATNDSNPQVFDSSEVDNSGQKLDFIEKLSEPIQVCIAALMIYLKDFNLDKVFNLTNNFSAFSSVSHMHLNGNTILSLELFQNRTNFKPEGSLFYTFDYTKTKFGKRRLRKWVKQPLIDRKAIEERLDAAQELSMNLNAGVADLVTQMSKANDMEFILTKIYYKRCNPRELFYFLLNVERFSKTVSKKMPEAFSVFKTKHMRRIFNTLPLSYGPVRKLLSQINSTGAKEDQLVNFFAEGNQAYEDISDLLLQVDIMNTDVTDHLEEMKVEHKLKSLDICEFLGKKYFKVQTSETKNVPNDWLLENKTRFFSRYRTPRLTELLEEIDYQNYQLDLRCKKAFDDFMEMVNVYYDKFRALINAVGELDCFLSLSLIASHKDRYVRPKFVDHQCCEISQGRHPMIERYTTHNTSYHYVPNDTKMNESTNRTMIITGPNMGGKSSYVSQIALIVIMAQIGFYVPAKSATLGVVDAVYTRMGAYDNIIAGRSTFQTELMECSDILRHATPRSLILLDEVGRGTGTMDGVAIAHAVLEACISDIKALTLFITHYALLTQISEKYPQGLVGNYHMDFEEEVGNDDKQLGFSKIIFKYNIVQGVVHNSYGLNVARLVELPSSIIQKAAVVANELKQQVAVRKNVRLVKDMCDFIKMVKMNRDINMGDMKLTEKQSQALYRMFSTIPSVETEPLEKAQ